jgi:hypothetical protein
MGDTVRADERSQPIMRVPRDKTPGELILDDGERSYALFFVAHGDTLSRVFEADRAFIAVAIGASVRMIARARIACMTVHVVHAHVPDEEFPQERQRAIIRLKGGSVVRGELRWVAPYGHRRTIDHLNDSSPHVVVYDGDYIHFVAKAAIVSVEEY